MFRLKMVTMVAPASTQLLPAKDMVVKLRSFGIVGNQ